MGEGDPLEDLLVNKDDINRERLSQVLKGVIGIDEETGDPVFRGKFSKLSTKEKIAYYLLYRRAGSALGLIDEDQLGVESKELADKIGTNYNTTRSILSKANYIEKDESVGGFIIPIYSLEEAIEVVSDE